MHTGRIRLLFLIVCFGCLFLCSCGLDEYYVINPPVCDNPHPYNQDDQMYYQFRTASVTAVMSSQVMLKGTSVYYKLYPESNISNMLSEMEAIHSANGEFSSNGYTKAKNTYNYKPVSFLSNNSVMEYLSQSGSDIEWKFYPYGDLAKGDGTGLLKLLTNRAGTDGYIEKPTEVGEYYINAYAVTVGEVSLQPQYSQLAPLGVLKISIH